MQFHSIQLLLVVILVLHFHPLLKFHLVASQPRISLYKILHYLLYLLKFLLVRFLHIRLFHNFLFPIRLSQILLSFHLLVSRQIDFHFRLLLLILFDIRLHFPMLHLLHLLVQILLELLGRYNFLLFPHYMFYSHLQLLLLLLLLLVDYLLRHLLNQLHLHFHYLVYNGLFVPLNFLTYILLYLLHFHMSLLLVLFY